MCQAGELMDKAGELIDKAGELIDLSKTYKNESRPPGAQTIRPGIRAPPGPRSF